MMSDKTLTTSSGIGRVPWAAIAIGAAMVASTAVGIGGWERVRTRPKGRMIDVTGSAKKRIVSASIEWTASIETKNMDRTAAAKTLPAQVKETEYIGTGAQRIEKTAFKGYKTGQDITIRSNDVPRIERISREITQLL